MPAENVPDRCDVQRLQRRHFHDRERSRDDDERDGPSRPQGVPCLQRGEREQAEDERWRVHAVEVTGDVRERAPQVAVAARETEQQRKLARCDHDACTDLESRQHGFRDEVHDAAPSHGSGEQREDRHEQRRGRRKLHVAARVAPGERAERDGERQRNRRRGTDGELAGRAEQRIREPAVQVAVKARLHRHAGELRIGDRARHRVRGERAAGEQVTARVAGRIAVEPCGTETAPLRRRNELHQENARIRGSSQCSNWPGAESGTLPSAIIACSTFESLSSCSFDYSPGSRSSPSRLARSHNRSPRRSPIPLPCSPPRRTRAAALPGMRFARSAARSSSRPRTSKARSSAGATSRQGDPSSAIASGPFPAPPATTASRCGRRKRATSRRSRRAQLRSSSRRMRRIATASPSGIRTGRAHASTTRIERRRTDARTTS